MDPEAVKYAQNRAHAFCEEQQAALDEGRITEAEWFEIHKRHFTAAYLAADNPRAQSGHSGDAAVYRYTRGMILEAIDRSGTFIDVGCANGHLIEMVHRWLQGTEVELTLYGLDISEGLLDLARARLPHWRERFYLGNALYWTPPQRFDYVCIAFWDYVPCQRRRELLDHLWHDVVAPEGRLIFGPWTAEREKRDVEAHLSEWGYRASGYVEKSHRRHEPLCKRMVWFDKPERQR
jgi:2-polyprenyl-3-methyl-5-hydroxy-6-metoxy-1,4-benzoquinol methylase